LLIPLQHAEGHPLAKVRKQDGALRGRFALWTGFMPVRGPLHIDDMWPRGIVMPEVAEAEGTANPEARKGEEADSAGEIMHQPSPRLLPDSPDEQNGFMFFVALNDRRASWTPNGPEISWTRDGVGLSAGPDGWAGIGADGLWWWKDESLAREVSRLYRDWETMGRPTIRDYQVTFLPIQDRRDTPPGGWQIERRYYREVVTEG
jgi:hypothetical protein